MYASGDHKREDVASATVDLMCQEAGAFAFKMAMIWKVKNVIACGSFFNHSSVWPRVGEAFLHESLALKLEVNITEKNTLMHNV